jgi:hypothetical protein
MIKDFLGQTLAIGDHVVYLHRTATSAFYIKGIVMDFVEHTAMGDKRHLVKLQVQSTTPNNIVSVWPSTLIRYEETN